MALTAAIQYVPQLDPTVLPFQDRTNYGDSDTTDNMASRTLTILEADGLPLTGYPNPIPFPYTLGNTIKLTGLKSDVAVHVTMTLTPIVPQAGSSYTATVDIATTRFLSQGLMAIETQRLGYNSNKAEANYRHASMDALIEMNNSQVAILFGDYEGAQNALDRGQQTINNTVL